MKEIKIYTTNFCPFCIRAKNLLKNKNLEFSEFNLSDNPEELQVLKEKTGLRTVPQIFIDNELIGGFDQLKALDTSGELKQKLGLK